MPEDRTTDQPPPIEPVAPRRPDRIVRYAARGPAQLTLVLAATAATMVLLQIFLYEVIGDRGDVAETALRGLVVSLVPIVLLLFLVREARRRG
ncbi:MAG TPA: hypothetical protein VNA14_08950 [Mycobacteriales bacterium]|nr:hypothetical protein [Mycobacteriales bacterium]